MAWIGKIHSVSPIPEADKIQRAEVVCGEGGKWAGVVGKDMHVGQCVVVFLPDAVLQPHPAVDFMEKHGYRVKMMRLKGCPSEVVIVPIEAFAVSEMVGTDVTDQLGVLKYEKEVGGEHGVAKGNFPSFIPKTDEINFQKAYRIREAMIGKPYYIATKYDGTSQTFYHRDGKFGACSRNLELREGDGTAWEIAERHGLFNTLPTFGNVALQWECVGPKIQGNPLKLSRCEPRLFDVWDIDKQEYYCLEDLKRVAFALGIEPVDGVECCWHGRDTHWENDELRDMARGCYMESLKPREGIVIRTTYPFRLNGDRLSFKVINLDYKE
jgi:RNA ligase (TIGR02306 family)